MNLEVLVSTMNLKNLQECNKLKDKMNIKTDAIIINQITNENIEEFIEEENCRIYSKKEKGLSKSRNKAIQMAKGDICIIADDDVVYKNGYENIIKNAYKEKKDADIIAFYVKSNVNNRPTTVQKEKRCRYISSMKIASFQITFKRENIIKSKIMFDENFGAGSEKYCMGEENIFLFDCLNKNMKIYFIPITIAEVNHIETTWFNGFNDDYFKSRGACFYRMSRTFSYILIYQFALRKRKLFKEHYNIKSAIKMMLEGKNEYQSLINGRKNGKITG